MSRIFLNYRRQDSEGYVGRLYDRLLNIFEADQLFMDVSSIPPGVDFIQALEDAVSVCDVFLVVIGPNWLDTVDENGARRLAQWNDFVRLEITTALRLNKYIIPVLVGRAKMPLPDQLPDELKPLARRNAHELTHQGFAKDVEALADAIRRALPAEPAQPNYAKPAPPPETLRQKQEALHTVYADLLNAADSPLYPYRTANRHFPVIGEGSPDANIFFIGEAPSKFEAEQGRPFTGPSGEVLNDLLNGIGLRRDAVFLTNLLLDRLPDQRDPQPDEIAYYAPFISRILAIIQPRVVVPLGLPAALETLRRFSIHEPKPSMTALHGKLIRTRADFGDLHILPMFHPAVVLYSGSKRETLRQDFEKLNLFM